MTEQQKPKPKGQLNTLVKFSGLGIQMGVTIYLGVLGGEWLDEQYPNEKGWFKIGGTLLAVVLAMYSVISEVNKSQ
jgi:hypothetical protein